VRANLAELGAQKVAVQARDDHALPAALRRLYAERHQVAEELRLVDRQHLPA
jgi:hypothetical protein